MKNKTKKSLPDFMRTYWSDDRRFVVLCLIGGLLCGIVAVLFHLTIHHLFHWIWHEASTRPPGQFIALMLLAPTLAGLLVGLAVHHFSPDAAGSGIPQTKAAYYNKGGKISSCTGLWRFGLGALYVGLGNSLGREGPTVHISTAITSRIGRWAFNDPARVQSMAPVGMAAGIAAAFNAPLSALTFVFEELLDDFSMKALGGMVVAVVIAAAVSRTLLGEDPVLAAKIAVDYKTSAWMLVALPLGVAAGIVGHLFVRSNLILRSWCSERRWLPLWIRPATGGLSCGILGLIAYHFTAENSVFSIGYGSLEQAFTNTLSIQIIAILLGLKFLAVVINYATGGSGGLFSPTLFLGGMLGALIGAGLANIHHLGEWIPQFPTDTKVIGGCVLLGMGAMFAAVIRCPFTSLIIIFEMTGNYSLILPLMAGNMLAWHISRRLQPISIYNALLLQDGISLRSMPAYRGAQDYRKLPVQTIMTHDTFTLSSEETLATALKRINTENAVFHAYPVITPEGTLAGVITRHELSEHPEDDLVQKLVTDQNTLTVSTDTSLRDAANQMIARDFQQVPVVSPTDPKKLLGWLTSNDIARQQNAAEA